MKKHFRWVIVALIFIVTMINYLDRSALSFAIEPLQKTFQLTDTDFGWLGSAFGLGYLFMTIVGGVLVDRYGARKIWALFAILWSISCACIGLASGFVSLFIFRILLGFTEGPAFEALIRVITDWLHIKERARAAGLALAALPFASVVGAPFLAQLISTVGWRWMFFVLGSLGIVWAVIWYALFRDKPEQSPFISSEELTYLQTSPKPSPQKTTIRLRSLLLNPSLMINNYAFFASSYILFFAITWLPGYLQKTYLMPIKSVGWFLVTPWLTATVFLILGGIISDYLWNRTGSIRVARAHLIWVSQLLSAISFLPILFSHSIFVAAISISLGVGFALMSNSAFYSINADLAHDRAATSLGIMNCSYALSGILAPVLTGWLVTRTGNFSVGIVLMVGLTLSSALLIVLFQHPDKPKPLECLINIK